MSAPSRQDPAASAHGHAFYEAGLTGMRALAAFWVMLFHIIGFAGPRAIYVDLGIAQVPVHPLLTCGWVGVDLFFVLSGFLLTAHLLHKAANPEPGTTRRYFMARIRRVVPAYWAQLLVLLAVALIVTGSLPAWARYVPLHLPMLHFVSEKASWAINGVYWTLPIEFGFYLCLPLIVRVLARAEGQATRWKTLALVLAAAMVVTWLYRWLAWRAMSGAGTNSVVWAVSQLPGSLDIFVAGAAAATGLRWWRMEGRAITPSASTVLTLSGLAGVVAMIYYVDTIFEVFWTGHPALFFWHTVNALLVALLVLGIALGGRIARALFANPVSLWLGLVSYGIYLWHYPILQWLKPVLDARGVGLAGYLAIAIALSVAAAAASWYLVERRFLLRR